MSDWLVCGVDRSPHSPEVVAAAARFAGDLGLRLMVVRVADTWKDHHRERNEAAQTSVDDLQAWMTREPSVRWDTVLRVAYGHPARELLRLVRECDARMLVVGAPKHGRLAAMLLASRPRGLGRKSYCPLLTVPTPEVGLASPLPDRFPGAPSVVCGVGDLGGSRLTLAHAAEMAWARGARLVLTHVLQAPGTAALGARATRQASIPELHLRAGTRLLKQVAQQLAPAESVEMSVRFGDPAAEIDELAASHAADLIVVGSRRPSALGKGSVSAALAARASRPVLIVPHTASSARLRRFCPSLPRGLTIAGTS